MTGGVPAATTRCSRPHRLSCNTPARISACVDRVSRLGCVRSTTRTRSPARAISMAVAAPAHRAPTITASYSSCRAFIVGSLLLLGRWPAGVGAGRHLRVVSVPHTAMTSTEIGTPLAMESKTTERSVPRCTTSRSFSAGASPEMRMVIRICSNPLR